MATTPRQVIDSVVRSVCGHEVAQLVRLTSGGVNETYRVELAAAGSVVVRIGRQPVPWFTDEATVMAQARPVGVPTPDLLGVAHVDHAGELLARVHSVVPDRGIRHALQPPDERALARGAAPRRADARAGGGRGRRARGGVPPSRAGRPRRRWRSRTATGCPST